MTSETATDRDEPQELIQHFEMHTLAYYLTRTYVTIKCMNNNKMPLLLLPVAYIYSYLQQRTGQCLFTLLDTFLYIY